MWKHFSTMSKPFDIQNCAIRNTITFSAYSAKLFYVISRAFYKYQNKLIIDVKIKVAIS